MKRWLGVAYDGRSVTMVAVTSAVGEVFERISSKFDLMFAKRAFTHWYLNQGMELEELHAARMEVASLEEDCREIQSDLVEDDEEEREEL